MGNLSQTLQKVLSVSEELAKKYGSSYIGSEHILYAMLICPECTACKILTAHGIQEHAFADYFIRSIDKSANVNGYTPLTKQMIDGAVELGGTYTRTEHLLYAILNSNDCLALRILRAMGIKINWLANDTAFVINMGVEQ